MSQHVLDHVPYVYLDQNESYWPDNITKHLIHTTPKLSDTPMQEMLQTTLIFIIATGLMLTLKVDTFSKKSRCA